MRSDSDSTPEEGDAAGAPLTCDGARSRIEAAALTASPAGRVGLELEGHLVDLAHPAAAVEHSRFTAVLADAPDMPGDSRITVEPGGQVELSTPPHPGIAAAVRALRDDRVELVGHLRARGLGLAGLGAYLARPPRRVNPVPRYAAMERHFVWSGQGIPGRTMMCSTAALQVNLDAGAPQHWAHRVSLAQRLGPVLAAVASCSPLLLGRPTGWRSTRQAVWGRMDLRRCGPLPSTNGPGPEWAHYALRAPVMLIRHARSGHLHAVTARISFDDWLHGRVLLDDRRPTAADLDYHLSTLFPPVRLRGYVELRYLDAVPDQWWPAVATVASTLLDHPGASDVAWDATEPVAGLWRTAARSGVADPQIGRAARVCLTAAAAAAPAELRPDVEALAELVAAGRSIGDDLLARAQAVGAVDLLGELAS